MLIQPIPVREAWRIRHEVMYEGFPLAAAQVEGDEAALHLGLFDQAQLITVVSLFEHPDALQFRKFASIRERQGKGFGSCMMQHLLAMTQERKRKRIWCNARQSAVGFYEKFGMQTTGDCWQKEGLSFIIMEKHFT